MFSKCNNPLLFFFLLSKINRIELNVMDYECKKTIVLNFIFCRKHDRTDCYIKNDAFFVVIH